MDRRRHDAEAGAVGEVDVEPEMVERRLGSPEGGVGRDHRDALGPPVEHPARRPVPEAEREEKPLPFAQTERRSEPWPRLRWYRGFGESRPVDLDDLGVETRLPGDRAEGLRRVGREVEPDLRVDEGGVRQAALEVQKRRRIGKAEERAAKA